MINFPEFAKSKRFLPLFGTQFLGAFNDNVFKTTLFVLISFYGLGQNAFLPASQMLNLGALLFVLPYFLFSTLAGQLANRWNQARLAQYTKILEIVIMSLAGLGFYYQSASLLLLCLFLMGTQSTFFGPIKYAILPEYLHKNELLMGNSLIESGTFLAILMGQMIGTAIAGLSPWILTSIVVSIAVLGYASSTLMPNVTPKQANAPIDYYFVRSTKQLLKETYQQKSLFIAIMGISWFWFVGSVYTTQLPTFVQTHLGGNDHVYNLMLALFSIGIAVGSIVCARLSRGELRLGLVLIGGMGLTVFGLGLVWFSQSMAFSINQNHLNYLNHLKGLGDFLKEVQAYPIILMMLSIGFFGGFFSVPLYTWLQSASPDDFRAHAIASNNIINALFMVASAMISMILLMIFNSIGLLYALVALGNVAILLYLVAQERLFWTDLTKFLFTKK